MNLQKYLFLTTLLLISTSVFAQTNTITKENVIPNGNLSQFGVEEICPICGYVNCICDEQTTEIAAKISQSNTTGFFVSIAMFALLAVVTGLALAKKKLYKSKLKI
ncbi:hypothetical protein QIA17_03705 [Borreliella californiensis]|uniref:Uncharacterized protein n=1 Tax=Borreliella californiensis TaxID=373543 RepID=A0A7W9ZM14_9SPIR|nr:hypothetical protein [Borreliella californiensis]MBB6212744.1 hypothetical protein [Borreliella californiensis]WKC91894.1 hypothetical protein QIA17_03705 [Borreliella californiensis]WNY70646.1 hypothetical protein QIA39_03170 [Borreliella californiensis]